MKGKRLLAGFLALMGTIFAQANPPDAEGKAIFTSRCAACHKVNKVMTGPALAGVDERRSIEWITRFVQSSQQMVKNGDKDAVAIFQQFNKIVMPDHPDLSAENIRSILDFISSESKPADNVTAPFAKPSKLQPAYRPLSLTGDYLIFLVFLAVVALLIAVLVFAVRMNSYNQNKLN